MRPRTRTGRAGAVFTVVTATLFYGLWTSLAFGAVVFFADAGNAPNFPRVLTSGLLLTTGYWQIVPILSAGFGASLDLRKLLAYPITHRKLFTVEVLLRLTSCGEMLIVIGGAAVGLLRNPLYGWKAAPFIFSGALIFVAMNVFFSAGARYLIERVFLRSGARSLLVLLLAAAGITPQFLMFMQVRKGGLLRFLPEGLYWPWAAAAQFILGNNAVWSGLAALLYLIAAYLFGRWQFERSIRYDSPGKASAARGPQTRGLAEAFFRAPSALLPDPLAALVEKELRTFARIPRFRMAYPLSCLVGIGVFLPALRNPSRDSFAFQNALPLMALYGLLIIGPITYWNAFGFDRSATEGYFCWPLPFRSALIAKNLAVALMAIPQVFVVALESRIVRVPLSPAKLLETIAVVWIAALYWLAAGNICSVRVPRAMDPDKLNQMANKLQALSIFAAPVLLLPIALAYWARYVFASDAAFMALMGMAAIVGGIVYKIALDSATAAAERGRESMLLQLSRSDGPLSIT